MEAEDKSVCEELILIVCEMTVAEEVVDHLREVGVTHFTLHHGAFGVGETGRHEGTPIWPGENSIIFCGIPEEQVEGVVRTLKEMHNSRPNHILGIKIFALPVRELL
ncbi:MAG: hypothetical protein KA002_00210 [Firmicutes bacterium]|nr:hypothetical protein [Bacillota bacterium]